MAGVDEAPAASLTRTSSPTTWQREGGPLVEPPDPVSLPPEPGAPDPPDEPPVCAPAGPPSELPHPSHPVAATAAIATLPKVVRMCASPPNRTEPCGSQHGSTRRVPPQGDVRRRTTCLSAGTRT